MSLGASHEVRLRYFPARKEWRVCVDRTVFGFWSEPIAELTLDALAKAWEQASALARDWDEARMRSALEQPMPDL